MNKRSGTLAAKEPFDLGRSIDYLRGFGPMIGEQQAAHGAITKALLVDGRIVVFRATGRRMASQVDYELFSESTLDDATAEKVAERISFFLSLEDDVAQFYAIARNDEAYYPKVKALWGLHHVKFPSLLEISCWAIINQRIQRPTALRMKQAILERYGEKMELDGQTYWAFPDYERLKAARPSELLALTKSQRVTERIGSLIAHFDEFDEKFLLKAPYEKAEERLQRVKGIGGWSSQFILYRGLGRIERQGYSMKPIVRMMGEVYGPEKTLDDINRTYGKWCGYWSLYLWASSMAASPED